MKKKLIIPLVIMSVLSIWVGSHYFKKIVMPEVPETWVQATVVRSRPLLVEAKAIGTLIARSVEITPEVAGHVSKVLFKDGEYVARDKILVQLDDELYKTKYDLTKARLEFSKKNYARTKQLGNKGVLSKQAVEQAQADLKEKSADAKENAVLVAKMKLFAPFAGRVGKSNIDKGDYVTVGQHIVTLTDVKHLRVEYHFPEKLLSLLKLGQDVSITTIAYPNKVFRGKVAFISPTINRENRSILVYADVPNDDGLLAAGMFVNVTQSLGIEKDALMLKAKALVPILDGDEVYRVIEGKAYAVAVSVGKRINDEVQILHGLSIGDTVITDGQLKVKNGMPVKIKL